MKKSTRREALKSISQDLAISTPADGEGLSVLLRAVAYVPVPGDACEVLISAACMCGAEVYASTKARRKNARRAARHNIRARGWVHVSGSGWLCPECAQKNAGVESD